jgi:hypothetical protein
LLLAGVVLVLLLPTATHRTYTGGGSQDTRYLLSLVPALLAPLALWFECFVWPSRRRPGARVALLLPVLALCAWGALRSYLSLLAMFGHRAVERTPADAFAILRANWRDLHVVAPGYFLLHYFVVLAVPLALACWLLWLAGRRALAQVPPVGVEGESPS